MAITPEHDVPLAIFDFDHTLIRCDSFAGFIAHLLRRRWWRLAVAFFASPLLLGLALFRPTRLLAASTVAWIASVGLRPEEFHTLLERHAADRFGSDVNLRCRTAIQTLVEHHTRGDRVVIVTGAPVNLVRHICRSIGIPADVDIIGSTLRHFCGGWITGVHCFGRRKVQMLADIGIARADHVYTDSASDLPLMKLGARPVLVNAHRRHRARVAAELGQACDMVTWV